MSSPILKLIAQRVALGVVLLFAVSLLIFVVLVLLTSRSADYRDFYSSPIGVVVILLGSGMTAVGSLVIRRLSRVREETRVLVGPSAGTS